VTDHRVPAGECTIVEGGLPSTRLFVLRDGTLDLLRGEALVTVMRAVSSSATPASSRARRRPSRSGRSDYTLYCIPGDIGVELLSREEVFLVSLRASEKRCSMRRAF